jgi:AcrR family transcriptional regulator
MDDLAEELGISKQTLYAHFPGGFAPARHEVLKTLACLEPRTKPGAP